MGHVTKKPTPLPSKSKSLGSQLRPVSLKRHFPSISAVSFHIRAVETSGCKTKRDCDVTRRGHGTRNKAELSRNLAGLFNAFQPDMSVEPRW